MAAASGRGSFAQSQQALVSLPCAKLQLDSLFMAWLSRPECHKLVSNACALPCCNACTHRGTGVRRIDLAA